MYKTKHAQVRQQQRGIKNEALDILFKYGKRFHRNDGTAILCFPRRIKEVIESRYPKIKNLAKAYAVILLEDSRVITVGHHYKKSLLH